MIGALYYFLRDFRNLVRFFEISNYWLEVSKSLRIVFMHEENSSESSVLFFVLLDLLQRLLHVLRKQCYHPLAGYGKSQFITTASVR